MTTMTCEQIQPDLVAAATDDTSSAVAARVRAHIADCAPCRIDFDRYRDLDRVVGALRRAPVGDDHAAESLAGLERRLADLRRRVLSVHVWDSPVGPLLIARSEEGVALVEYLDRATVRASRLSRRAGVELIEDGGESEPFYRQLVEYLRGERTRLPWPLDFRLARSGFMREVLRATSDVAYGAVTSYGHIAREVGKPAAVRAVAQALRWNPLPLVVPCHRVVGGTGALTGYAGSNVSLKARLLSLEGVPTTPRGITRGRMYVRLDHETAYCLPTCGDLSTVPLTRLTLFGSRERAEAVGLNPCADCRPDLHPLSA